MLVCTITLERAPMMITLAVTSEATVVSVSGELDLTVADELRQCFATEIAHKPPALIIDLSEVRFCSAVALGILAATRTAADAADLPLAIVSDQRAVRRPMTVTGLDSLLRPVPRLAVALARLDAPPVPPVELTD